MTAVRAFSDSHGRRCWTVVDDDGVPITPADDFLAYLQAIERSPNTQRAYAYDLRAYFEYLQIHDIDYSDVTAEDLAYFVQHLRRPAPRVPLLVPQAAVRVETTVNRIMSGGVGGMYRFLEDRESLPATQRLRGAPSRRLWEKGAFLAGITGVAINDRTVGPRLRTTASRPRTLSVTDVRKILDACVSARDVFLFTLLATTGMRRGQALGLRHCDINTRARTVTIVPRDDNVNGARAKSRKVTTIPISRDVARLYLNYMHAEYGDLDCDYVFVSLIGPSAGQPLTEGAVDACVRRLRERSGLSEWSCHSFRHTFATLHHRAGMRLEIISHLLTHGSVSTTATVYSHLDVDDLRQQLVDSGCWDPGNDD